MVWMKNNAKLIERQLAKKNALLSKHLKTGRAYMTREELQEIYAGCAKRAEAETGLNNIIQSVKRRSRGYRDTNYFAAIIYPALRESDLGAVLVRRRGPGMNYPRALAKGSIFSVVSGSSYTVA